MLKTLIAAIRTADDVGHAFRVESDEDEVDLTPTE